MELLARFEGRELYLAAYQSLADCSPQPPGRGYYRLLLIVDEEQAAGEPLAEFARRVLDSGAYAVLAAGGAAEPVEEAFDDAIIAGRYEASGRSFVTAVSRGPLEQTLWDAFYSMAGDADIEEDVPAIVIAAPAGGAVEARLRELAGRLARVFAELPGAEGRL